MNFKTAFLGACAAALALLGPSAWAAPQQPVPAAQPLPAARPAQAHPALWKLSDHDTTIYLFGTIHVLPDGIDWFNGPVAYAFNHADVLVTELPDFTQGEMVQGMLKYGVLGGGQSLRSKLGEERRGRYEAGLTALGQQPAMFDRNKPWVPALLVPLLALQKFGYDPKHGVEAAFEARNKELKRQRIGLESIDFQFGMFASLSEEQQLVWLDQVITGIPEMKGLIDQMVASWARGDTAGLAKVMNSDEEDPALTEAMLYSRNRTWTKWVEERMKQPGTVFIAVGAGHLGGKKSVIDLLAKQGFKAARVQ